MPAIERLNEILKQLKTLENETDKGSTLSRLDAISSFVYDLPDITQQLETAIIDLEDERGLETA